MCMPNPLSLDACAWRYLLMPAPATICNADENAAGGRINRIKNTGADMGAARMLALAIVCVLSLPVLPMLSR